MIVFETERLRVRHLSALDASFILRLVNEPGWLQFIGDRGVRTVDDAARYIERGPVEMQRKHGFSLFAVELRETARPIGICGLLKRDALEDVDLGFAFLADFQGLGYAFEAATAT